MARRIWLITGVSSGFGRELGQAALEHYTEVKTVWMNMG